MGTSLKICAALAFLQVSLAWPWSKCGPKDNKQDCNALVDLFEKTQGTYRHGHGFKPANWCSSDGWLSGKSYCTWEFVTCDENGRVSELAINHGCRGGWNKPGHGNGLIGPLPDTIGDLTELTTLGFSGNLELGFDFNENHTNAFPKTIGKLSKLTALGLSVTNFKYLPDEIGNLTKLEELILTTNGMLKLPDAWSTLKALKVLDIGNNPLGADGIPPCIGGMTALETLNSDGVGFVGPIPDFIGNLKSLKAIDFRSGHLTGKIPDAMCDMPNLTRLELGQNLLTGFPDCLGKMTGLEYLAVENNKLTGPIPDSIADLKALTWLQLNNNSFTGAFNTKICNMPLIVDVPPGKTCQTCLMRFSGHFDCPLPDCASTCIPYGPFGGVCGPEKIPVAIEKVTEFGMGSNFSIFTSALDAAPEVKDVLNGKGPFTVFVPENEAFAALPASVLANLLKPENKAQLAKVLTFHVMSGRITYDELTNKRVLKTLAGKDLTVSLHHGTFLTYPVGVHIVEAEIWYYLEPSEQNAANGIIHRINQVLIPDDDSVTFL